MPQLQSGVGWWQENERLFRPDQIQHCALWYHDSSVPPALLDSPVLLALFAKVQCPHKWILGSPHWISGQTILEWDWFLPFYSGEVLQVSTFPQGMEWVSVSWITASHDGIWAESSSTWFFALVKCVMGLCPFRCRHVGCFGNAICLLLFSHERKPFFYDFLCLLPASQHMLAVDIAGWLVMSWSQLCITLVGEGSYPLAIGPTLGARFGLSQAYHPS